MEKEFVLFAAFCSRSDQTNQEGWIANQSRHAVGRDG